MVYGQLGLTIFTTISVYNVFTSTEMKDWFYFFDKNGDERLDLQELGKVFSSLCWDLTDRELEDIMASADKDS